MWTGTAFGGAGNTGSLATNFCSAVNGFVGVGLGV